MPTKKLQKNNNINIFLNDYFNIFIFVGLVFVFGFSYFLFIKPKLELTKSAIQDNIEIQKKLFVEQEKKLRDLKTMKEVYDEISPTDLKKFEGILPSNYVKEVLFGELEEIIIKQGFLINSVSIEADDTEDNAAGGNATNMPEMGGGGLSSNIGMIKLSVSVGAVDYNGFKQLLKVIETNSRLFDLDTVSFGGDESTQLELITYYYKPGF